MVQPKPKIVAESSATWYRNAVGLVVVVVVVTFFNHNFVICKATLILETKIYEI